MFNSQGSSKIISVIMIYLGLFMVLSEAMGEEGEEKENVLRVSAGHYQYNDNLYVDVSSDKVYYNTTNGLSSIRVDYHALPGHNRWKVFFSDIGVSDTGEYEFFSQDDTYPVFKSRPYDIDTGSDQGVISVKQYDLSGNVVEKDLVDKDSAQKKRKQGFRTPYRALLEAPLQ